MKLLSIAVLLVICTAVNGMADSLVITYRSGKKQSVELEYPLTEIGGTEYVSSKAPAHAPVPTPANELNGEVKKQDIQNALPPRSGIRLKWASPKTGD